MDINITLSETEASAVLIALDEFVNSEIKSKDTPIAEAITKECAKQLLKKIRSETHI